MGIFEIICGVILLILSGVIMITVVLQESSKGGIGALAGGDQPSSFFDKNRGKTKQSMLVRATAFSGVALVVIVVALLFLTK